MPNLQISAAERGGFRQVLVNGYLLTVSQRDVIEGEDGDGLEDGAEILGVKKCAKDGFILSHPLEVSEDFHAKALRAVMDFIALQ